MSAAQEPGRHMQAHPAADLFPMLSDEALEPIVDCMRSVGFDPEQPILRYRGQILDGRNRLRASAFAGVEPVFRDVADDVDPFQESWRRNGMRRDLRPGERAAILAKITTLSIEWQTERAARQRAANEARAEKANARRGDGGKLTSRSSNEDPQAERRDNRAVTALAQKAGVSRPTMERALKLAKEAPQELDAVIRGEKRERKKPPPRIDREQRHADVRSLHELGLGTREIAGKLKLTSALVSQAKVQMGIAETSPAPKLWRDIDHVAVTLEGAGPQMERLTDQLQNGELSASDEEIRKCIKSLYAHTATVNRLRNALKRRLL